MFCVVHPGVEAEGVCVICRKAFCPACGSKVNKLSLCESHAGYEILEGRARVFGSLDNVQARFAASCLEQAGLHPFFYSRFFNPGVAIGPKWSWRLFDGHITQEMKVFVPFDEVLEAGKVLADLKL